MARTKGTPNRIKRPPTERITGDISPEVAQEFKSTCALLRISHGQALEPVIVSWLKEKENYSEEVTTAQFDAMLAEAEQRSMEGCEK